VLSMFIMFTYVLFVILYLLVANLNKGKKVKLSLCLTKHHAMKTYWGMELEFLNTELDDGE
jgi:hypothetical protein